MIRSPIRRVSRARRVQNNGYTAARREYLAAHPFCQITIARQGLDEAEVVRASGWAGGIRVPRATAIHHRNKRDGARLTDTRWFLSTCWREHEWVEGDKQTARLLGFLLPVQADADGRWGAGNRGLPTPEFMASRIK